MWVLFLTVRLGLGTIFAVAGIGKLLEPTDFEDTLRRVLPRRGAGWTRRAARLVAAAEIVVGGAVAGGVLLPASAAAAILLLATFIAVALQAIASGLDVPCSCFGRATEARLGWGLIARNVALSALAASLIGPWAQTPDQPRTLGLVTAALAVLAGLAIREWRTLTRLGLPMPAPADRPAIRWD